MLRQLISGISSLWDHLEPEMMESQSKMLNIPPAEVLSHEYFDFVLEYLMRSR